MQPLVLRGKHQGIQLIVHEMSVAAIGVIRY
jgi:hypothetical protein